MVKKIGKLFILIFSFVSMASELPTVKFGIYDAQGAPLLQPGIGVPFSVKVVVEGEKDLDIQSLSIDGLEKLSAKCKASHKSFYMRGQETFSKVSYDYTVRIDEEGEYTIGPVRLLVNGKDIVSEQLKLIVGKSPKLGLNSGKFRKAFVHLFVDKERVFVGQEVDLSITLHFTPDVRFDRIYLPEFTDIYIDEFPEPIVGSEKLDGNLYKYFKWKTKFYPKRAGDLVIPAVRASVLLEHDNDASNIFRHFFMSVLDSKQINSNALRLTVESLPVSEEPVDVVGSFTSFDLSVDQTRVKEGEGIVAKIVVKGRGDLKRLKAPKLNLPKKLISYESKSSVDLKHRIKQFEYIIQAVEPGDIEIPAQDFTFFDPEEKRYKTLKSNSIMLNIETGNVDREHWQKGDGDLSVKEQQQEIKPLAAFGPWHPISERRLPERWFYFFMLLPVLWFLLIGIISLIKRYRTRHAHQIRRRKAFGVARKFVSLYEKQHDVAALYQLFISLIAARAKIDEAAVSESFIEQYFKNAQINSEKLEQWRQFFGVLAQARFFSKQGFDQTLFARSRYWIIELEKQL